MVQRQRKWQVFFCRLIFLGGDPKNEKMNPTYIILSMYIYILYVYDVSISAVHFYDLIFTIYRLIPFSGLHSFPPENCFHRRSTVPKQEVNIGAR